MEAEILEILYTCLSEPSLWPNQGGSDQMGPMGLMGLMSRSHESHESHKSHSRHPPNALSSS
jgi:hypothetical protein